MFQLLALEPVIVISAPTALTINVLVRSTILNRRITILANPIMCHARVATRTRTSNFDCTSPQRLLCVVSVEFVFSDAFHIAFPVFNLIQNIVDHHLAFLKPGNMRTLNGRACSLAINHSSHCSRGIFSPNILKQLIVLVPCLRTCPQSFSKEKHVGILNIIHLELRLDRDRSMAEIIDTTLHYTLSKKYFISILLCHLFQVS